MSQETYSNRTLRRAAGQVSSDLEGETVILNTQSGLYFGLNAVGRQMWNDLAEPHTAEQLTSSILSKFQVDEATCRRDVVRLLSEMESAGLVEACSGN